MSSPVSQIVADSVKSLLVSLVKLAGIAFSWVMKLTGMLLTKAGEIIEKIVVKKSQ